MAVDWWIEEGSADCFCQDNCTCMADVGGGEGQLVTASHIVLPRLCGDYLRLGTGWCIDDAKSDMQRQLPALYKEGADEEELKALCDKYQNCVAVDWGNNENGHLRFGSAAALMAVNESGWGKWADGCTEHCVATTAGDGASGECHIKNEMVLVDIPMTWTEAQEYCRTHFSDLVSVHSSQARGIAYPSVAAPQPSCRALHHW